MDILRGCRAAVEEHLRDLNSRYLSSPEYKERLKQKEQNEKEERIRKNKRKKMEKFIEIIKEKKEFQVEFSKYGWVFEAWDYNKESRKISVNVSDKKNKNKKDKYEVIYVSSYEDFVQKFYEARPIKKSKF